MDAPRDDDDDFPEELDSFELDIVSSAKKLNLNGSSGGTGTKPVGESPPKIEPVLESKLEQVMMPEGGITKEGVVAETKKVKKDACCTLF